MEQNNQAEIVPGDIVLSLAGHDKNRLFLVHSIDKKGFLVIIDGRYRKLDKPKAKNPKHCMVVAKDLSILLHSQLKTTTNAEIYKLIQTYKSKILDKE